MYRNLLFLISFFVISTHAFANNTSKSVAMGMISSNSMSKISTQELHNLMDENIQDFIVEFDTTSVPQNALAGLTKTQVMHTRSDMAKSSMRTMTNSDSNINIAKDYSMLPMMAVKTQNRAAFAKILNRADVKRIYENKTTDALQLQQSLPLINQLGPENQGHIGDNTSIAILDTGVDYTKSPFGCTSLNTPSTCRVPVAMDFGGDDGQLDENGHGTNVAAIASSVAPGAKIIAMDVRGTDLLYRPEYRMDAINWILANKSQYNIVSMNMSIGDGSQINTPCSDDVFTTPFADLRNIGVVPVVSSGNSRHTNGINRPSCVPGAVSVGAVYDANVGADPGFNGCTTSTAADKVTCFSNSGDILTMLAPGAPLLAGGGAFPYWGTSQAAPHVAGAIAVLRANDVAPNDSIDQTMNHLTSTGVTVVDYRNSLSRPRLNLEAAINDAIISSGGPLTPTSPINGQTVNTSTPTFTWTPQAGATAYAVEALDVAGNQVTYRAVSASNAGCSSGTGNCATSFSDVIPDGVITWRVRTSPNTGGYGATATFTVDTGGAGAPLTPVSPINGQTVNTSTPTFTWTAQAGATAYAVEALDAGGNQVTYRAVSASNAGCSSGTGNCATSFSDVIPDGVITWRVRTSPNTGGYGATATFTVNTGGNPNTTPVALTPADGSTINDTTPAFTWTEVPSAPRYGVLVKDSIGTTIFNQSTGNNLPCPGGTCSYIHPTATLSNGNYTWSVKVINADNSNGPNSSTLSFTVSN